MKHTVESIETYAFCPRKYKFKYIEKAAHTMTHREVFQISHRKAIHAYLQALKDGESPTSDTYMAVWASEWESRKGAIGVWPRNTFDMGPPIARDLAESFASLTPWTAPTSIDVLRHCKFGVGYPIPLYTQVDFEYGNISGLICFRQATLSDPQFRASFAGVGLQCLDWSRDLAVIVVSHRANKARMRLCRSRIGRRPSLRVMGAMLDQITAIESGCFPRCNPEVPRCSRVECGYWRACTRSPARTPRKES